LHRALVWYNDNKNTSYTPFGGKGALKSNHRTKQTEFLRAVRIRGPDGRARERQALPSFQEESFSDCLEKYTPKEKGNMKKA
jgi:hypothetical protein